MPVPSEDMVDFLAAASLSFTKGTNAFMGPIREHSRQVPKNCLFVNNSPGSPPSRVMGDSVNFRNVVVDIRIRWNKFAAGDAKARAVMDALQGASISGYLDVGLVMSEPSPMQRDMNDLFIWQVLAFMFYQK